MTTTTIQVRLNVKVYIDKSILTATPQYARAHAREIAGCARCYVNNHSKASNADDKVLSNSASGVDSDIGIAPFDPGAGKKCFESSFC